MRGKTNIAGGGASINGTEVEKIVAPSATISKGDFVEYYTVESSIANTVGQCDKVREIGDDYIICLMSSSLSKIKVDGTSSAIIKTFSTKTVIDFTVIGGKIVAVTYYELLLMDYDLNILSSVELTSTYLNNPSVASNDDFVIVGKGNADNWYYKKCTISGSTLVVPESWIQTEIYSSASHYNVKTELFGSMMIAYDAKSQADGMCTTLSIDTDGLLHVIKKISGRVNGITKVSSTKALGWGVYNYICAYLVDLTSGNIITYKYDDLGIVDMSSGNNVLSIARDGLFIMSMTGNNKQCLMKYDADTGNISQVCNPIISYCDGIPYLASDGDVLMPSFGQRKIYIKKLNEANNRILDIEDSNYVKPYTDSALVIGVAKQSGSAGDSIICYEP